MIPAGLITKECVRGAGPGNRLPGGDRLPDGVVSPTSTDEVATVVRLAGEHGMTLWPTSTGHNFGLGEFSPVREGQVVLHLGHRMNRILKVNEQLATPSSNRG